MEHTSYKENRPCAGYDLTLPRTALRGHCARVHTVSYSFHEVPRPQYSLIPMRSIAVAFLLFAASAAAEGLDGYKTTYDVTQEGSGTGIVAKGSKVTVHATGSIEEVREACTESTFSICVWVCLVDTQLRVRAKLVYALLR